MLTFFSASQYTLGHGLSLAFVQSGRVEHAFKVSP